MRTVRKETKECEIKLNVLSVGKSTEPYTKRAHAKKRGRKKSLSSLKNVARPNKPSHDNRTQRKIRI